MVQKGCLQGTITLREFDAASAKILTSFKALQVFSGHEGYSDPSFYGRLGVMYITDPSSICSSRRVSIYIVFAFAVVLIAGCRSMDKAWLQCFVLRLRLVRILEML